jgi:hypothetical protein
MWIVYSVYINRIDRTTRGNTQWSIEGASRWVSIILSTGKGNELGPGLIRSGPSRQGLVVPRVRIRDTAA